MRDDPCGRQAADWPRRQALAVLALACFVVGGVGCGSKPPPPPTKVSGSVQAADDLNPSVSKRPSPLRLRVYELRSPTPFNQADFMALYQSDQVTLGPDMMGRDELVMQPGETRPYAKVLAAETRFIGVFALYRDLEHATWRAVVPVVPGQAQQLLIRADSLAISASVRP